MKNGLRIPLSGYCLPSYIGILPERRPMTEACKQQVQVLQDMGLEHIGRDAEEHPGKPPFQPLGQTVEGVDLAILLLRVRVVHVGIPSPPRTA